VLLFIRAERSSPTSLALPENPPKLSACHMAHVSGTPPYQPTGLDFSSWTF